MFLEAKNRRASCTVSDSRCFLLVLLLEVVFAETVFFETAGVLSDFLDFFDFLDFLGFLGFFLILFF
jgi:hypothetical protein